MTKKVMLVLVDSIIPEVLERCVEDKTVPALQFLMERGKYWRDCVTVFPTMTASVDSSLMAGVYPDQHRVPGLIWYDPESREIINYINGWKCVTKLGISKCAENVLVYLNEKHLSKKVTTIFEELAKRGKTSAAVNAMVHRGHKKHRLKLPSLMRLATGFRLDMEVSGPDLMTLGAMVETDLDSRIPSKVRSARNWYGINDTHAVKAAKLILDTDRPDFLFIYLPDNDHEVHKISPDPQQAGKLLIQVDKRIQEILNQFLSWEDALNEYVVIVTGDHGQTKIGVGKEYNIDLDVLLQDFVVLQLGEEVGGQDLVVCNNERMAYIHPLKPELQEWIIDCLSAESRIDVISWKEKGGVRVREGGSGRELFFAPDGPMPDKYGRSWKMEGEERVLDVKVSDDVIHFGDYPDAFSRLYGALYSQDIPLIAVTARPQYEFKSRFYPTHQGGGSHGSLHKHDSLVPLIVAGTDESVPQPPRLVDLKDYMIRLLDE